MRLRRASGARAYTVGANNTISCSSPHATIVGQCFASQFELNTMALDAATSGEVTSLASAPGCYSVVLSQAGRLSAYTDPVGQFPLFWAWTGTEGDVLVNASASDLANEIGAAVDMVSLAARIACPGTPDLFADRTMYQGVHRILEGTVFQVDHGVVKQTEYGRIRADSTRTMAEAAETLRDRLCAAVDARCAVARQLSTDFSGGFDSTSLAFLAGSGDVSVVALTSEGLSADSDDLVRARAFADLNPNLTHRVIKTPDDSLPYRKLVAASEEPHATPMFLGHLRTRLAVAKGAGADLHLVGEGGDVLLSAPPAYLADLVRQRDFTTLWRHCVAWARLRTRSPHKLFRRALALGTTSRRRALLTLARDLEREHSATTSSWEDDWIGYWRWPGAGWLTTQARKKLASAVLRLANHDTGDDTVGDLVTRSWLRSQTLTQQAVRDVGREFGISVHAPFLDSEVVRACLTLPAHRRADPTAYKPLLRAALSELLPHDVLSHGVKGDYTGETHQGVRQAAPALRQLFVDSVAADCGLIEPKRVLEVLDNAIQGLPTPWDALSQVIAVELWLRDRQRKVAAA